MIGVLHTARINAVEFIVSSDKLIKMVNFKLHNLLIVIGQGIEPKNKHLVSLITL